MAFESVISTMVVLLSLVALGAALARLHVPIIGNYPRAFWDQAARLAYNVCTPAILLATNARLQWSSDMLRLTGLALVAGVAVVVTIVVAARLLPISANLRRLAGAISHQYNGVFIGFPVVAAVVGPQYVPYAALVASVVWPLTIGTGIVVLRGDVSLAGIRRAGGEIANRLVRDPILLSVFLGFGLSLIEIPSAFDPVLRALDLLGAAATPLALLTIGATLGFQRTALAGAALVSVLKLALAPAIAWTVLWVLGATHTEQLVITLILGMPLSMSAPLFVFRYTDDEALMATTSTATTISTIASLATIGAITALL